MLHLFRNCFNILKSRDRVLLKCTGLHFVQSVKWVFTASLEGTCSKLCGDWRWSLSLWPSKMTWGSKSLFPHRTAFSSSSEEMISLLWESWADKAEKTCTVTSILLSVQRGRDGNSGGSDYWDRVADNWEWASISENQTFFKMYFFCGGWKRGRFPWKNKLINRCCKFCLHQEML